MCSRTSPRGIATAAQPGCPRRRRCARCSPRTRSLPARRASRRRAKRWQRRRPRSRSGRRASRGSRRCAIFSCGRARRRSSRPQRRICGGCLPGRSCGRRGMPGCTAPCRRSRSSGSCRFSARGRGGRRWSARWPRRCSRPMRREARSGTRRKRRWAICRRSRCMREAGPRRARPRWRQSACCKARTRSCPTWAAGSCSAIPKRAAAPNGTTCSICSTPLAARAPFPEAR